MRAIIVVLLSVILNVAGARADDNTARDAREAAAQAAADRASQKLEADAERTLDEAAAKQDAALTRDKRRWLGSAAVGRSDGDVNRLYDDRVNAGTAAAASTIGSAQRAMRDPRANAQMKAATGKSMQEYMRMSPEEQQEWAAEMQEEMGSGQ